MYAVVMLVHLVKSHPDFIIFMQKNALGMLLWYNKFFWKRATTKARQQFCGYSFIHTQIYTLCVLYSPFLVPFLSERFIK